MVSSFEESVTICVRLQTTVDGIPMNLYMNAKPSILASKIKDVISQARFGGQPVFLTADKQIVQDDDLLEFFKDGDLYAGLV